MYISPRFNSISRRLSSLTRLTNGTLSLSLSLYFSLVCSLFFRLVCFKCILRYKLKSQVRSNVCYNQEKWTKKKFFFVFIFSHNCPKIMWIPSKMNHNDELRGRENSVQYKRTNTWMKIVKSQISNREERKKRRILFIWHISIKLYLFGCQSKRSVAST